MFLDNVSNILEYSRLFEINNSPRILHSFFQEQQILM